jgi:hypothetical protein
MEFLKTLLKSRNISVDTTVKAVNGQIDHIYCDQLKPKTCLNTECGPVV